MFVDLASLLKGSEGDRDDDSQNDALQSAVRFYIPPVLAERNFKFYFGLAMSTTHLAAGVVYFSDPDDAQSAPSLDRKYGMLSIDFGTMRCQMVDEARRWQDDESRKRKRVSA